MPNADPKIQQALIGEALDEAPVGILVADAGGRYIAANLTACRQLGYARDELLQLTVADLAPWDEMPDDFFAVVRGELDAGTYRLKGRGGSEFDAVFRVGQANVAGVRAFVAVGFPLGESVGSSA